VGGGGRHGADDNLVQRPEQLRILSWRVQRKYDARKTLEAFSSKLRDQTDLRTLGDDLVSKVKETMQPEHVSLWLRPDTSPKDS
jgi:hypothetical protein